MESTKSIRLIRSIQHSYDMIAVDPVTLCRGGYRRGRALRKFELIAHVQHLITHFWHLTIANDHIRAENDGSFIRNHNEVFFARLAGIFA